MPGHARSCQVQDEESELNLNLIILEEERKVFYLKEKKEGAEFVLYLPFC